MTFRMTAAAMVLVASSALAQTAEPSADALRLARELVSKTEGNRSAILAAMTVPMVGMLQQMGIRQQDRAQAIVQEAILPLLNEHYDDLLAIQAKSYASILTVPDLQGAIDFYDSPAGQDFIRAQPQLAQAKLVGISQWVGGLQPEIQTRIENIRKAHGWDKD